MSLDAIRDDLETALSSTRSPEPVLSHLGLGGLLFDPRSECFDMRIQRRLQALGAALSAFREEGITELVLGVNNLLVLFDPMALHPEAVRDLVLKTWPETQGVREGGREHVFPVVYGGKSGEDLPDLAAHAGMSVDQWVEMHSNAIYTVACIGAMPGFAYLGGLPAPLAIPRRTQPRVRIPKGSVIVGGVQAGIQPCDAPSGWHLVGMTEAELFDPHAGPPCLLAPGDTVRFVRAS